MRYLLPVPNTIDSAILADIVVPGSCVEDAVAGEAGEEALEESGSVIDVDVIAKSCLLGRGVYSDELVVFDCVVF